MSIQQIGMAWFSVDQNLFQLVLGKKNLSWLAEITRWTQSTLLFWATLTPIYKCQASPSF